MPWPVLCSTVRDSLQALGEPVTPQTSCCEFVLHCKDTITKILNKYSQKRNCTASVPTSTSVCLWAFIYSQDRCAFSAAGKYVDRFWEYINPSNSHMNVEIGTETALFLFWEYINGIFVAVWPTESISKDFPPVLTLRNGRADPTAAGSTQSFLI